MTLLEIPLQNIPNQRISTILNKQNITLDIYQRDQYLFCDIYIASVLIAGGVKCNNAIYLNQYPTDLVGYLFFYTTSGREPTYLTFGKDAHLFYSDYDALEIAYQNWVNDNKLVEV